ncbi:MAG: aminotransferase class III-fold pyridoxal phosphate-dependent enzyme, partial [Gammaproteobacteria bacterium]|nr:aminotransferase class III-fold pyridoxal phosphate-dependent enzyme [Gammaproteobacteria bacterium]
TGSEANELALRIARACTGGDGIIIVDYAYHGNTHILAQASMSYGPGDAKPAYIETVSPPDVFRGEFRGADAGERYASLIQAGVDALLARGVKPAAFLVDTIVSSNGILDVPPGYLGNAADVIRSAGGLFIADEVQPGFGRTGDTFWGFERDGLVPDIVTMGKPIGNGHPLAATVTRADLARTFASETDYFNTFGGNPVSAAAGLAVLDVIEREELQKNARDVGTYLRQGLRKLAEKHELIGDVRGSGLFLGVDLVTDRGSRAPASAEARKLTNALRKHGILTNPIGKYANILKLRPPMVFSTDHADLFLETFDRCLSSVGDAA